MRLSGLRRPSWSALVWVGVLLLALTAGLILADRSEAGNTDVLTASALPVAPNGVLPEQVAQLWSTADTVDDQRIVAAHTVIVSSARGIRGLDPITGVERWHYLRSTATMCDLTVLEDVVVAIFRTTGRCNEAVALEAGSGVRRWYRNVGFSDRLSLLGAGTAAVAATPGGIAVLDSVGDSIRWRYNPPQGCELSSVAVGTSGVVALESCETGTTWLAQFELYSGDQQWRVAPPSGEVTVVGADGVVSLVADQQLLILGPRDGRILSTMPTTVEPDEVGSANPMFTGEFGDRAVPLIYLDGTLLAIEPANGAVLWSVAADGLPASNELGLVVVEEGAFVTRDPLSGAELSRTVATADPGSDVGLDGPLRLEQSGSSLVAVSDGRITAYA